MIDICGTERSILAEPIQHCEVQVFDVEVTKVHKVYNTTCK